MSDIKIKNIVNKPLKKDYEILVPYSFIDKRINASVLKIQKNYKQKGFRDGKVPLDVIKNKFGNSIMAEESEKIINETSKKIVENDNLKIAISPKVDIKTFEFGKDFSYVVSMEIFPQVPDIDLQKIKLVKKEVEVTKSHIDSSIDKIVNNYKKWDKKDSNYKSKEGDAVNIDYVGKIKGKEFEGGSQKGHQLELGSKSFIDTFEKQLIGKKSGDKVLVKVKFPKDYHNKEYAEQAAEFDVNVNSVLCSTKPKIDDKFIKENFGLDNLEKLEEFTKNQVDSSYKNMSLVLFKKELFDFLDKKFKFALPDGLIEEQFKKIWASVEKELESNPKRFKNDKEREKYKIEKRNLSERMIRGGIILSDISQKNNIVVSNDELMIEINKKASQFPGQEKQIAEYYQKNPSAVQDIRGAILEDKVVNFIMDNASIKIKNVSSDALEKEVNKLSSN